MGSLLECRSVESAEERLQCYDAIVDGHAARSEGASVSPSSDPAASQADVFGLPPVSDDREQLEQIEATVVDVSPTGYGKVVVALDNGQTWRQTTSSTLRVSKGDEIVIRRRAMGSYSMTKEGTSRSMKVKRVE